MGQKPHVKNPCVLVQRSELLTHVSVNTPRMNLSYALKLLIITAIIAVTILRFIHLDADTPAGVSSNVGLYVDEGYKTLSARNMALFGKERWHHEDDYSGWLKHSPFTQWPYYFAFSAFGVNIQSARSVSIIFFLITLCFYAYVMSRRYDPKLLIAGIFLLGLQNTIFFFSRVALFELPLIMFTYCLLFLLIRSSNCHIAIQLAFIVTTMFFSFFFVKASGVVYMLPVFVGTLTATGFKKGMHRNPIFWIIAVGLTALVIYLTLIHAGGLIRRFSLSFVSSLRGIAYYRLLESAPLTVITGAVCALHALLCRPRSYFENAYRCSLLCIVIMSPLVLAHVGYDPLRYFVPVLPAYVLIILEWIHLQLWRYDPIKNTTHVYFAILLIFAAVILYYVAHALNYHIFKEIYTWSINRYFLFIASFLSLLMLALRKLIFHRKTVALTVSLLLTLCISYNCYILFDFLKNPSYRSKEISSSLAQIMERNQSIAGDWAPFLTLSTSIRSLYMDDVRNRAERVMLLRPDFFLFNGTKESEENFTILKNSKNISLGFPVYVSNYNGNSVIVYPIVYQDIAPNI